MKKMIFLFGLCMLIATTSLSAQEKLPYRPFESFQNDTLAFIEYNFQTRADCYIGKTVAEVIKDIQLPILSYIYMTVSSIDGGDPDSYVVQISLYAHHINRGKESPLLDYYVSISFKNPIIIDDSWLQFMKTYDRSNWIPQHYDYFKDLIVKRVESNPFIIMKREKDKAKANNKSKYNL